MAGVFLSYGREDSERARQLARVLEKAGHHVWWDLHVRGGAQFSRVIEESLKAAEVVLVLWSRHSVESAWVRDEATAGRDTGRLVPVTIDGTEPPLGFRQFQTIDLSGWKGRGAPAEIRALLADVSAIGGLTNPRPLPMEGATPHVERSARRSQFLALVAVTLILAFVSAWVWSIRGRLIVVEVAPANSSPGSQSVASDLLVKLGSLSQVANGRWQLVDAASAPRRPDLLFRTADSSNDQDEQVNLVLLDGKDKDVLWSREFSVERGGEADRRQQLSLTAGRVLRCALASREDRLRKNLLKIFLNACSLMGEDSAQDPTKVPALLRQILGAQPQFAPAWSQLLLAEIGAMNMTGQAPNISTPQRSILMRDMASARATVPGLPELMLAQAQLLPATSYGEALRLVEQAAAKGPDNAEVQAEYSNQLLRVGRMEDGIAAARKAFELDPLSPTRSSGLIMALAYAGQVAAARQELAREERIWSGTGALRDALWAFHLRFGDPKLAKQYGESAEVTPNALYLNARLDPSPANIKALVAFIDRNRTITEASAFAYVAQSLGEFGRTNEFFSYAANVPPENAATSAYVLFRPAARSLRNDPRFFPLLKRIGLIEYWQRSGKWPDFCIEPDLPYDCQAEAAKLSR